MDEEKTVEYTDNQLQFLELIKKYPVKNPETVVDYVTSQGETVLEEPTELAQALSECEITPVRRRQILKHWFANQGIDVPEPILKQATMSAENKASVAERETKRDEKYSVDTENGAIKVASTTDKTALTWDEAEKLSTKIKKDIEAREKKEAKEDKGDKEAPFIIDGEGNWQLNPKAKIGGMELLAFEAVRKSQERGEPLDPFEVLQKRAEEIETMRSVFGGGKEGGRFVDSVEDLLKLKQLLGADEDTKTLLAGIYKYITEGGAGKGESEDVKALREELKGLTEELQRKDRETLVNQLATLSNELTSLRGDMAKVKEGEKATSEYGIMSEALKVLDRRAAAIENALQGVFGKRPPPLAEAERKKITEAISEEALAEQEIDKLAEKAFYEHS